jgi:hypothetical protein
MLSYDPEASSITNILAGGESGIRRLIPCYLSPKCSPRLTRLTESLCFQDIFSAYSNNILVAIISCTLQMPHIKCLALSTVLAILLSVLVTLQFNRRMFYTLPTPSAVLHGKCIY